ncbi:hypothetical protein KKH63_03970 [Patescibacteria group bacterium]|nr:hypothetical protein [Patescibacteria group bacterium]
MTKRQNLKTINPKNTSRFNFEEPQNYDKLKPIFSFRHMNYGGGNCLSHCDSSSKASVVKTLLQLSQLTWSQILSTRKESHGKENIPIKQFKVPLPSFVTPDVKSLMVFRFSESERMAGIRHNDIYHILIVGADLYGH